MANFTLLLWECRLWHPDSTVDSLWCRYFFRYFTLTVGHRHYLQLRQAVEQECLSENQKQEYISAWFEDGWRLWWHWLMSKLASKYLEMKDNNCNILMHQEDIYIYDNAFWMKDNNKKLIMSHSRDCYCHSQCLHPIDWNCSKLIYRESILKYIPVTSLLYKALHTIYTNHSAAVYQLRHTRSPLSHNEIRFYWKSLNSGCVLYNIALILMIYFDKNIKTRHGAGSTILDRSTWKINALYWVCLYYAELVLIQFLILILFFF